MLVNTFVKTPRFTMQNKRGPLERGQNACSMLQYQTMISIGNPFKLKKSPFTPMLS